MDEVSLRCGVLGPGSEESNITQRRRDAETQRRRDAEFAETRRGRKEKRDGNTEFTEGRAQRSQRTTGEREELGGFRGVVVEELAIGVAAGDAAFFGG